MKAICKRELRVLMSGIRGWGYVAIVWLGAAISVLFNNLLTGSPKFEMNVMYIALSMIPATALASMDSFQAERRQNTERLLFSLPIRNSAIVMGKLLAHIVPVLIASAGLCLFPLMFMLLGGTSLASALAAVLALAVLGIACMAAGLMISACSSGRTAAFLTTAIALVLSWAAPYAAAYLEMMTDINIPMLLGCMLLVFLVVWYLSRNAYLSIGLTAAAEIPMLLAYLQGSGARLLKAVAVGVRSLSLFEGLGSFVNGLLDGRMMILWAGSAVLFLFVTLLYMGNRRQAKRRAL